MSEFCSASASTQIILAAQYASSLVTKQTPAATTKIITKNVVGMAVTAATKLCKVERC